MATKDISAKTTAPVYSYVVSSGYASAIGLPSSVTFDTLDEATKYADQNALYPYTVDRMENRTGTVV